MEWTKYVDMVVVAWMFAAAICLMTFIGRAAQKGLNATKVNRREDV